jgi:enoyl-CoA hydratase
MTYFVKVTRPSEHPHVALVTLDNPPVNAVAPAISREIISVFTELGFDLDVHCVVLTGAGEKAFIAGADIRDFLTFTPASLFERSRTTRDCFDAIRRCRSPVIGAIGGHALGAGVAVAAACDVLVVAEGAKFALPEINVGILGGTKHLSRLVPAQKARWMAMTGQRIGAEELHRFGSVEKVVPRDRVLATALAMADELAGKIPTALRLQKEALNLTEDMPLYDGYHVEQFGSSILTSLPESKEAARGFLDRGAAKESPKT